LRVAATVEAVPAVAAEQAAGTGYAGAAAAAAGTVSAAVAEVVVQQQQLATAATLASAAFEDAPGALRDSDKWLRLAATMGTADSSNFGEAPQKASWRNAGRYTDAQKGGGTCRGRGRESSRQLRAAAAVAAAVAAVLTTAAAAAAGTGLAAADTEAAADTGSAKAATAAEAAGSAAAAAEAAASLTAAAAAGVQELLLAEAGATAQARDFTRMLGQHNLTNTEITVNRHTFTRKLDHNYMTSTETTVNRHNFARQQPYFEWSIASNMAESICRPQKPFTTRQPTCQAASGADWPKRQSLDSSSSHPTHSPHITKKYPAPPFDPFLLPGLFPSVQASAQHP
jgi:hypothetical protein